MATMGMWAPWSQQKGTAPKSAASQSKPHELRTKVSAWASKACTVGVRVRIWVGVGVGVGVRVGFRIWVRVKVRVRVGVKVRGRVRVCC